MKTKVSFQKIIVASVISIAIIVAGLSFYKSARLKNSLANEKLKSEIYLSEKLSLDKSVAKFQKDLADLKGKNSYLDNLIAEANLKILHKNKEIDKLMAENVSAKELQNKIADLENLKKQLNIEIEGLNNSLAQAKTENSNLNNQLASTTKLNAGLTSDNSLLKAIVSDNYRTEALRGKNEKLTVNARKTNKLMVSFDLPGNIGNDIYFKVVTPQGKELSSNTDLAATIQITENGDGLLANSMQNTFGSTGTKRVEMTYKPNQKLSKGVYQFNLYNANNFLGSTQLRLK